MTARFALTAGLATIIAAVLLWQSGLGLILILLPLLTAWLAYVGAVRAAIAYGEALEIAFDLGRFDLLTALHAPLPADRTTETTTAQDLCRWWRQGSGTPGPYHHPN